MSLKTDHSSPLISLIDPDSLSRDHLRTALERENLNTCEVVESEASAFGSVRFWIGERPDSVTDHDFFARPVRLGALLDRVRRASAAQRNSVQKISVGPYELDVTASELRRADKTIRLTDKEREILILLSEKKGEIVDRNILLEKVWAYAQGLETHTLETHIYRLRQKIERDPAKPDILLTDGAGYKIA